MAKSISKKDTVFGITQDKSFAEKNIPTGAKKISSIIHGGPGSGRDIKMFIDRPAIEALYSASKFSPQGKAQLNYVGIEIDTWVRADGSTFEVWKIISAPPKSAI
tara:strand:- start:52610 stop:52924 length:315 start_codon:yes stop_codon:yes gene_type:complete